MEQIATMETRICKQCGEEKSVEAFATYKDNRNGKTYYKSKCKECYNLEGRKFYDLHKDDILANRDPEKVKAKNSKYYINNRDTICVQKKEYNKKNKKKIKVQRQKYYQENKDEIIAKVSIYAKENRAKINKRNRDRKNTDIGYKLSDTIRSIVKRSIRQNNGHKAGKSTLKYLPYSIKELKEHLERQFEPWMSWENWGIYDKKTWKDDDSTTWTWQLDHKIPKADLLFDDFDHPNFIKCWGLENLRPLKAKQNIEDGAKRTRHKKRAK